MVKVSADDVLAREWHELMGRYQRITCTLDRELQAAHGLTASDFEVLQQLAVAGADGSTRLHELGANVHLTQSALSRLIARLERDGLVRRAMCPDDRRSVFATITEAGIERYLAARPTQRGILREHGAGCLASAKATSAAGKPTSASAKPKVAAAKH
ncbi:MAG: MarR family winged helix-turn-helix transcriptional regulator [Jatrophihabitantaceae bacterium]